MLPIYTSPLIGTLQRDVFEVYEELVAVTPATSDPYLPDLGDVYQELGGVLPIYSSPPRDSKAAGA